MRTLGLLVLAAILLVSSTLVLALTQADAASGSWCATYKRGVENCGYNSYEQCYATAWGLGGFCKPNPFPGTNFGTSAGSWGPRESPRRYRNY